MPRPNLFDYATKELSQDAVICWLIKWSGAQPEEASEHGLQELGRAFVQALLAKHGAGLTGSVRCPEIYQQNLGIDVLARVRDGQTSHVLLIEDKIDAHQHSDQLRRYHQRVLSGDSALNDVQESSVHPVFLKTGNQSLLKDRLVERESGYKVFGRRDFLDVLDRYSGDHVIVTDFRERLRWLEGEFTGYRRWGRHDVRGEWSWPAWEGFFRCLEDRRDDADWGYVPNRSRGFVGFWWHWCQTTAGDSLYLQFEIAPWNPDKQKLCFKVVRRDGADDDLRDKYHKASLVAGDGAVVRPARIRRARTMTLGVWKGDWLAFGADGRLDIDRTVETLGHAQRIVAAAAAST